MVSFTRVLFVAAVASACAAGQQGVLADPRPFSALQEVAGAPTAEARFQRFDFVPAPAAK